jgi:exonuclease SbcC
VRPRRLEIEGFGSFREKTIVDFADADLFVLSGPTGAGKSTIIDAITFALYGAVARYENQNLVWPVISQGLNRARVRLEFEVAGVPCAATRVVMRTRNGATTREFDLKGAPRNCEIRSPADMTCAVELLTGLPFEHFTQCVVLPQGRFAEFLHASGGDRQELLIRILGMDVYRSIAKLANQRATAAAYRLAGISGQLAAVSDITDDELEAARSRVAALEELLETLDREAPGLERVESERQEAARAAAEANARAEALAAVKMPAGAEKLSVEYAEARTALERVEAELRTNLEKLDAARRARDGLPERALVEGLLAKRDRSDHLRVELVRGEEERAAAQRRVRAAEEALDAAERRATEAEAALERTRREHTAADLAAHLVEGEPCPVCRQKVRKRPQLEIPLALEDALRMRDDAVRQRDTRRNEAEVARREAARIEQRVEQLTHDLETIAKELQDKPGREDLVATTHAIQQADAELELARNAETSARQRVDRAKRKEVDARRSRDRGSEELDRTRDDLSRRGLEPPPAERDDLVQDWRALLEWAAAQVGEQQEQAATHRAAAAAAERRLREALDRQLAACAARDVRVDRSTGRPRDACLVELATSRATATRLEHDLRTATTLRAEEGTVSRQRTVANNLALHLDARHFERWLMNRALRVLADAATRRLRELSRDAYSLTLDARNDFQVIDHRNADQPRPAKTLSGGETFLASLSLALALADHVADFASGGAARLDALFLDEGFGTLDAETLDIVASAIEELGSQGRMVGIVTHVRELAERIPIRFEVRKVGGGSTVEKVLA